MTTAPIVQPKRVLRVVEVTRYLKQLMERDAMLALLQVQGEVTNTSQSGSGWVYFTIKDNLSQLACVVSSRHAATLREELAELRNGVTVTLEGSVLIYEPRGQYQLNVQRMRIGGAGAARMRFERLRKKLEEEGLFAEDRKRKPVAYPRKLVLVTAPNSQAYHDVIKRLEHLWPRLTVIVAPVTVQGEQAPGQISTAIDIANRSTDADVIILARGGGSPEELDAFNDERLARGIFASRIPLITGIGHTQDISIADLVADVAATTPTAAAAAAVPDGRAMVASSHQLYRSIRAHMRGGMLGRRSRLVRAETELMRLSPMNRVNMKRQRLDDVWTGLERTVIREQIARRNRLSMIKADLARCTPLGRVVAGRHSLDSLWEGIETLVSRDVEMRRSRLLGLQGQLEALNPMSILGRGYAVLTDVESGSVVASTEFAQPGQALKAQVKDGSFKVTVVTS